MEIQPDRVHLFVAARQPTRRNTWANQFKGYTSHELRAEFARLRSRLPTLWGCSYCIGSAGHVSEETIKRYIASQKERS